MSQPQQAIWQAEQLLAAPFFEPLAPFIQSLPKHTFPTITELNALCQQRKIQTDTGQTLRFVPQQYGKLPFELQYEPRCYLAGEVATRAHNWHDLFNALVWLAFPKTKAAINTRHYHALTSPPDTSSQRGVIRDVNTLFDESGIIVASNRPELLDLLRNFQWQTLFCQQREAVSQHMGFYIFGHGIHEKALTPYIGLTAHGLLLEVPEYFFQQDLNTQISAADNLVTQTLQTNTLKNSQDLSPVPILGIPNWWPDNNNPEFYLNEQYFRAGRRKHTPL